MGKIRKLRDEPGEFEKWLGQLKGPFLKFWKLIRRTFKTWSDREPFKNSIVISYYTIFSLPGLLVIILNITGYFYNRQEVITELSNQIEAVMGVDTASEIASIINKATATRGGPFASVLGIATLLFGATGVFYQVQQMLNKIWGVEPKVKTRQKILELIRDRLFSFGLVLAVGFLMLVSLIISAGLSAVHHWIVTHFSRSLNIVFSLTDILISLCVITVLFASIFKFLPDIKIRWKEVWPGALITALLFVIAKFALGVYFGTSDPGSAYGAAGTIILVMLWVSYSGLILLFGAEFVKVYCTYQRKKVEPTSIAVNSTEGGREN